MGDGPVPTGAGGGPSIFSCLASLSALSLLSLSCNVALVGMLEVLSGRVGKWCSGGPRGGGAVILIWLYSQLGSM